MTDPAPAVSLVSVVIPTYHRPVQLARAVESALAQELPPGIALEVVIAVSDPDATADVVAASALAADTPVRVLTAPAPGPAAARNAGIAAARGEVLALLDDDCRAAPGWLAAALEALSDADLVQGRTAPDGEVPWGHRALWVNPPSWLWEACNLVVRRDLVDRLGGFDEAWNPTGRVGGHMGEDVTWGWRLVRGGARAAFAPGALVLHAVEPRTRRQQLDAAAGLRHFPLVLRAAPEARRAFPLRYIVSAEHAATLAALVLIAAGVASRRRPPLAAALLAGALPAFLWPQRARVLAGGPMGAVTEVRERAPEDLVGIAAALAGSVRWRRLLL